MLALFLTLTMVVSLNKVVSLNQVVADDCCNQQEFTPTEYGPQTREDAEIARRALQGQYYGGDILISNAAVQEESGKRFTPTEYGPQTSEDAENARRALQDQYYDGDTLTDDAPVQEESGYKFTPTKYGPQTPEAAEIARKALQGRYFGGDMIIGFERASGVRATQYRWPGYPGSGVVPYTISPQLNTAAFKALLETAFQQYRQRTCINFVPRTNERDYITFINGEGCYSYLGNYRNGSQPVSLPTGCQYIRTVVHELGHAIGRYHEHQRSDRDTYVNINLVNVDPRAETQFTPNIAALELISTTYEYESIMHYGNYAFTRNGRPTLVAKNGTPLREPYDKQGLTDLDVQDIRSLYKC